jgi:hypothetical protein
MKRNSATLYLESPGATTPLPWVDGAPDLSGFTEPTLSVLQQSWADFLASGQELEVVPDPLPPPPEPDWRGFTAEFVNPASSLYADLYHCTATLVQHCSEPVKEHWANVRMGLTSGFIWNEEIFQSSVNALLSYILAESISNPTLATLITDGNPPLQAQIDAWMTLANQHNIALTLDINP